MPQNRLLSKLYLTFKKVIFNKFKFSAGIPISDTKYKYFKSQNNNLFYFLTN